MLALAMYTAHMFVFGSIGALHLVELLVLSSGLNFLFLEARRERFNVSVLHLKGLAVNALKIPHD